MSSSRERDASSPSGSLEISGSEAHTAKPLSQLCEGTSQQMGPHARMNYHNDNNNNDIRKIIATAIVENNSIKIKIDIFILIYIDKSIKDIYWQTTTPSLVFIRAASRCIFTGIFSRSSFRKSREISVTAISGFPLALHSATTVPHGSTIME